MFATHNFMHRKKDFEGKRESVSERVYEILLILIPPGGKTIIYFQLGMQRKKEMEFVFAALFNLSLLVCIFFSTLLLIMITIHFANTVSSN